MYFLFVYSNLQHRMGNTLTLNRVSGSSSWKHTDLCRPPADPACCSWNLSVTPTVCLSLSLPLSYSLPHTQIWCSLSLKPVVVVLSIVWWSAKNNSSQKKTVASAACFCPPYSCCFFFPLTRFHSVFIALSLVCVAGQFCGCRSRKIQCLMLFQQHGEKKAKLAVVSLCTLECLAISPSPYFVSALLVL